MCRSIRSRFNLEPPATGGEILATSLQFVRTMSGQRVEDVIEPNLLVANAFVPALKLRVDGDAVSRYHCILGSMEVTVYHDTSLVRRIENAVEHLSCGKGNLRKRLISGCVANLEFLSPDEFPEDLRAQWRELHALLSKPDPTNGPISRQLGLWTFNLHTMSGSTKRHCAEIIFTCYRKLVHYRTER